MFANGLGDAERTGGAILAFSPSFKRIRRGQISTGRAGEVDTWASTPRP